MENALEQEIYIYNGYLHIFEIKELILKKSQNNINEGYLEGSVDLPFPNQIRGFYKNNLFLFDVIALDYETNVFKIIAKMEKNYIFEGEFHNIFFYDSLKEIGLNNLEIYQNLPKKGRLVIWPYTELMKWGGYYEQFKEKHPMDIKLGFFLESIINFKNFTR